VGRELRLPCAGSARQRSDTKETPADVASHRLKRAVRGAVSLSAVATVVASFCSVPALAQPPAPPPPPNNASEALKQWQDASAAAEKANEDLLAAQNDLNNKKGELDKATADLAASEVAEKEAHTQEEQFRGKVDALASASFEGARFNNLSALLAGNSQQDFLDRASALNLLATDNREALETFTAAVNKAAKARTDATDAQHRSQEAKTKAEELTNQIAQNKTELENRATETRKAYDRLSSKEKAALAGPVNRGVYLAPPGVAHAVVQRALDQVGKPYVFGADGPGSFDCSGLTMFAYQAGGVGLPHSSRAQYTMGKPVAYGAWQPGDLLFYGGSAGSIHHVAMYIGDGQIVHASHSGVPVLVAPVSNGGSDYFGSKRLLG
jgi:peptidoglycan DL-endopeptidase CwlO